jgi:hypothetical protein
MRLVVFLAATGGCFYYAGTHDTFDGGIALCTGINFAWAFVKVLVNAARADYLDLRR